MVVGCICLIYVEIETKIHQIQIHNWRKWYKRIDLIVCYLDYICNCDCCLIRMTRLLWLLGQSLMMLGCMKSLVWKSLLWGLARLQGLGSRRLAENVWLLINLLFELLLDRIRYANHFKLICGVFHFILTNILIPNRLLCD